ncbi:MAG TPA: branched-chain amino acid ABC transporter permease [Acetobacteraceae bacterium]|nr:branched-chain amino acid ABC transporter permease [Acetobacteraceae bacterium]
MLAQQLTNGVVLGSIYALSALGFTLIFGAARVVNFAYGEMLMLGAFATLTLMNLLDISFFFALPLAMLLLAAFSVGVYFVIVRPVLRGSELQVLLVTTGLLYVLHDLAITVWGTDPRQMDMGVDGIVEIGDVIIPNQRLVVVATMLLLVVALYGVLYKLRVGKALRAVAQNRHGAQAIGLNVNRVVSFAFAVSGALACAAGGLLGALYAVDPGMGAAPLLKSFVIVIFGGLGSVPGAIVGGLVIGLTETLTGSYISNGFKDVFTFLTMIGVLLFRPNGLLGARRT